MGLWLKGLKLAHTDLGCSRCLTELSGLEGRWTSAVAQEQVLN